MLTSFNNGRLSEIMTSPRSHLKLSRCYLFCSIPLVLPKRDKNRYKQQNSPLPTSKINKSLEDPSIAKPVRN